VATESEEGVPPEAFERFPQEPPARIQTEAEVPVFRPLRVYAFDSSLGRGRGNVITLQVPYEKLAPGPVGERLAVIDYDAGRDCFYDPVDLDDTLVAMRAGVEPSESDPHFHQQMVYAVVADALRRFEVALGRTVQRIGVDGEAPLRLRMYPHAMQQSTAHFDPAAGLLFGYFRAGSEAVGRTVPGQTIFTCLSHDVIVHTATHAVVHALCPDLMASTPPWLEMDTAAFLEGFSDLCALLLHFSHRDALLDTIRRTGGLIYRAVLKADGDLADGGTPAIQAELAASNPLLSLSPGFGEALGRGGGIRTALGRPPDPAALERALEPHDRGEILTAAVFDAFFSIYMRRSLDLFRIYRSGGGRLDSGDLPDVLAERLAAEATRIASVMLNVSVRALDYCPAGGLTFGDFLRACITADFEHDPSDELGVREALMLGFSRRGIKPRGAPFFSEDALRWPVFDPAALDAPGPSLVGLPEPNARNRAINARALRAFIERNAAALSLRPKIGFDLYPLQVVRRTAADDRPRQVLVARVVQPGPSRATSSEQQRGVTLVFDGGGRLRYDIRSAQASS